MTQVPKIGGPQQRSPGTIDSDHFCPGCGRRQNFVPRYPWYFCRDCLKLAEDYEGRRVTFEATTPLGGFGWRYAEHPPASTVACSAVVCLIREREVVVREARFGSVVAEPFIAMVSDVQDIRDVVRLSQAPVSPGLGPQPTPRNL